MKIENLALFEEMVSDRFMGCSIALLNKEYLNIYGYLQIEYDSGSIGVSDHNKYIAALNRIFVVYCNKRMEVNKYENNYQE